MDNDLIQDTNLDLLQVQVAEVEYSGQAPINVDNQEHIISLDPSALSSKLDTSAFDEWTATHSGTEYSAGEGIDITDHVISVTGQLTGDYLTKASADTLYYPLESNPSGYLTAHQDLSEYAKTDDLSAYQPVGDYYSASNPSGFITGVDLSDYYKKNETSSKQEISSVVEEINNTITNLSGKYYPLNSNPSGYLTAHQDISDKLDVTAFTSYTATAQGTEYTAGDNIDITNHVISGKDWTSTIESATTGKLDASAFNSGDFYPMTGNPSGFITCIDLTNYYEKNETSSKEEISAAFEALSGIDDPYELSAGDGIAIVNNTATKKTVISCTATAEPVDTGAFYPMTGNPSGFLTAHQSLTAYQPTADMTAYYQKNETSSKEQISAALSTAGQQLHSVEPVYISNDNDIGVMTWQLVPGDNVVFTENSATLQTVISVTGVPTGGGYLPLSATNASVGYQAHTSAVGLAQGSQVSARDGSFAQGSQVSALHIASVQGISATAYDCAMAQGFEVSARQCAFAQGAQTTADYCSLAQGGHCSAWSASIAQGEYNTASLYSQAFGDHVIAHDHTMAIGAYNKTSANTPFVIGNGTNEANRSDLFFINSTGGVSALGKISANGVELGAGGGGSNIHWFVDTPQEHTSADIDLTIQTTATLGGSYDRNLLDGNGNFIGALIPSATNEDLGKVLTITAGSPRWQNLPEAPSGAYGIKTEVVANSGLATGQNILYIVTGN